MFLSLVSRLSRVPPPDIWHNPIAIELIGIGIAIAAIFVAIAVGIYQVRQGRIRRKLVYQTLSNAPLVSVNSAVYNFEPLTFEFNTKASVLETTPPTLINPSALPTFLKLTPQSVRFPAFPLNPGDTVQMSILLERKGTLRARGRLDQGTVEELKPEKLFSDLVFVAAVVIAGVAGDAGTAAALFSTVTLVAAKRRITR